MPKFKDIDALKARAMEKLKSFRAKFGEDQAMSMVKGWLEDEDFTDESGNILKLTLDTITETKAESTDMDDKIAKAVKSALAGATHTTGSAVKAATHVETREGYELLFEDKKWGFKNLGEFGQAIIRVNHPVLSEREIDPRLDALKKVKSAIEKGNYRPQGISIKATPTTYASELVGADGGFLVPPEYRENIWIAIQNEESILSMTDLSPTGSNVVNLVADENTPWDNSVGIKVGTRAQGTTMTQSSIIIQNRQIQLNEVYALVPVADELIADAPLLNNYLSVKAPQKIGWKVDDFVFNGRGNTEPLGFLQANSLVTTSTSSSANTFSLVDLANMYSRLIPSTMRKIGGCWIMTPRAMAYLITLSQGTTVGFPVALANMNVEGQLITTLFGMPIYVSQHAAAFSSAGDIILADMKGYASYVKQDGIDFQTSIHLFFDSGAMAFRWRFRMGGEPYLKNVITPANDTTNTMSHFVRLAAR